MRTPREQDERQRGYAVERELEVGEPRRQRPRLGGEVGLPGSGSETDLFLVSVADLSVAERAAAGWCVRVGVPEEVPAGEYDVHELLVEVTVAAGGTTYTLELNAYPGAVLHVVGEQISAKVKWGIAPVAVPPGMLLRWQVARGLCATSAVRGYTVQASTGGRVPTFATGFALFSGDSDISENIRLQFGTCAGSDRIVQHYTREDLLQTIGAFAPLPPGAGVWSWLEATATEVRLVFSLGAPL